jgi:hypothetical protein
VGGFAALVVELDESGALVVGLAGAGEPGGWMGWRAGFPNSFHLGACRGWCLRVCRDLYRAGRCRDVCLG